MGRKNFNNLAVLFLETHGTDATRKLAADIAQHENQRKERGRLNYSSTENVEWETGAVHALQLKFWRKGQARAEQLRGDIDKHRDQYQRVHERDATRSLLELQRASLRFERMTDAELEGEMHEYTVATTPEEMHVSPDKLDALCGELKRRDPEGYGYEGLRKTMVERKYDEPWRFSGDGPRLFRELELSDVEYGTFKTESEPLDDGRPGEIQEFYVESIIPEGVTA
jgi:hypothetical protein